MHQHSSLSPTITADHRETPSGIPTLLQEQGAYVLMTSLQTGDYHLNNTIVVERKSAVDFIQSLTSGRLFSQCSRLVKSGMRPLILLEGDPYQTAHQIDPRAVKGALLSVTTAWQIPIMHSSDPEDSAGILLLLVHQTIPRKAMGLHNSYKPKKLKNHRLRFLQGLPNTGSVMAQRLYDHFGSIEAVIAAKAGALQEVKGLGKKTAEKIRAFVS